MTRQTDSTVATHKNTAKRAPDSPSKFVRFRVRGLDTYTTDGRPIAFEAACAAIHPPGRCEFCAHLARATSGAKERNR